MLKDLLIILFCSAALFFLLWRARSYMLMPLSLGKKQRLSLVLTVFGTAPELEQTVDGLCWLRANGTLPGEIVVRDAGMDEETRCIAKTLSDKGIIKLIN